MQFVRPLVLAAQLVSIALMAAPARAQSTPANAGAPMKSQYRKIVLITGSTDGLGREVALRIAATGAHVIIHGRNVQRGLEIVSAIQTEDKGSARFYRADFASLADVRSFAESILRDYPRLDVLINNAGIGSLASAERDTSADGYELHFAVNYLSHFLLTRMLLPLLKSSAPSRIINVASIGQAPIDFDDVMIEHGYSGSRAYGQSKLAEIMFTIDLAKELKGTGVSVYALHPATYMDTYMVRSAGIEPRSTVAEGAAAVLHLVNAPDLESGQFFNGLKPARANAQAYDATARQKLRELSLKLTGTS
jgi:NAD(P)-dependent dehydrogenase (short-subunit alcohol dehydrogenase family)